MIVSSVYLLAENYHMEFMKKNTLENLVTSGKLYGKKARERKIDKYLDSLAKKHNWDKNAGLIQDFCNCVRWRALFAYIYQHGT